MIIPSSPIYVCGDLMEELEPICKSIPKVPTFKKKLQVLLKYGRFLGARGPFDFDFYLNFQKSRFFHAIGGFLTLKHLKGF